MKNITNDLVSIREYGLLGSNFYWNKYAVHGLSKEDILSAGIIDDQVYVSKQIINALLNVNNILLKENKLLYIKEGYRSPAVYDIVYKRRVEKYGKIATDTLINMEHMPHASGLSVDVTLWDTLENKEIYMRNAIDGASALFVDFYKNSASQEGKRYHTLQKTPYRDYASKRLPSWIKTRIFPF